MISVTLIAHNIRSTHNVGSLFRTCDGFGVDTLVLSGYTPYPLAEHEHRLPYLAERIANQIHKTALGAEQTVHWEHTDDIVTSIETFRSNGYVIIAIEQAEGSIALPHFIPSEKTCLIVGNELDGIEQDVLNICDKAVEIPMVGMKESFNVSVAAAIALYHVRFVRSIT